MKTYEIEGIPVLKAVAFKSGDGWKDDTTKGQELFVWGVIKAPPYVGNSLPRIGRGKWIWLITPELHYFRPLKEVEYFQLKSLLEGSEEYKIIQQGLDTGDMLAITDMAKFLKDMSHPDDGGIEGSYDRMGIKTSKPKVITATITRNGGER